MSRMVHRAGHGSWVFVVLFMCLLSGWSTAQVADQQLSPQVDEVFSDFQKPGSPGCALGVFRNGQVIYAKGYGLASVELNAPISPRTVFDIGSTSKQFTAASTLLLEQQGKLSLSDDIRKYIPELPDYSKESGRAITILNLLNHTSGLRDYIALLQMAGVNIDSVTTDEDALALVVRQKRLNFTPGSQWSYSNTNFFLLSVIVKRVGGASLKEFASQNIFQPLHMTHTTFRDDHTMLIPNRALAYDPAGKGGYKLDVSYYEQLGDGAVHTSVEDLAKWDENFYSGQVGGKALVAELQQQGKLNNGKILDYAKGLFIQDHRGLRTVRHGGAWGGYRAELLRFPDQHFSVACLCNMANANPERRADRVADIYLAGLMKPQASVKQKAESRSGAALTAAQMTVLSGMYRNPDGEVAKISATNGKLEWQVFGSSFALHPLSPTEFVPVAFPVDAKLTFKSNGADEVMEVSGDPMVAATYKRVTQFTPSVAELGRYAGDYKSDELGVVYRLSIVHGKLGLAGIADTLGIPRTGVPVPSTLEPTITDEFEIANQGVMLHFVRDGQNAVSGFDLRTGRAHGIDFSRTTQMTAHSSE
jgi:CubicO group peptidase (beta-lactamase class C family)